MYSVRLILVLLLTGMSVNSPAQEDVEVGSGIVKTNTVAASPQQLLLTYKINPGDVLSVNVWNEESFSIKEVLVRPDGQIGMPIVGEVMVGGKTIDEAQDEIARRLSPLVKDRPIVALSALALNGNTVFVLGKVARPGQFVILGRMDVTMALALAGGLTTFAKSSDIKVLRRDENGVQTAIEINYGKIEAGEHLEQNILIKSGDVVVVP